MDLGAYANIETLDEIAKRNGVSCPRLRGYRLMRDESKIDFKEWVKENKSRIEADELDGLCRSNWVPSANWHTYSRETDASVAYYIRGRWGDPNREVRWDRVRGKRRRMLKTAVHNRLMRYKKQYEVWNKYAGKSDILYIHARIGGDNWHYYYKEVVDRPWFIEKVDDADDDTYCDIYARIKEE